MELLMIPDFKLSDEDIDKIYKIQISNEINLCDKKYINSIMSFMSGVTCFDDGYKSNISIFLDFCLNEKVYLCNNFTLVLFKLDEEIKKINNRFHSIKEKEELKKKIMLYLSSGAIDKYCFKILNSLLNCDINNVSTNFIIDLFKNEKISNNIDKRNIIFNILLKGKVSVNFLNKELYSSFWNLLSNDSILSLDNAYFEEIVKFSLTNINAYILFNYLNESYDKEKEKIIIDYIYNLLKKNPYKPSLVDDGALRNSLLLNPFYIINSLCKCSNEELKKKLNTIITSKRPISTSIVLSKINLDEKRKEFVLSLIDESNITEDDLNPNMYTDYYKYVLSLASISPLLEMLSFDEYKQILVILNEYISFNGKKPNNDVLKGIIDILKNPSFSNMDYLKLRYILYMIITTNSKEMTNFINNDNLNYYTTGEYVRALNIVKDNLSSNNLFTIKKLFTNNNLPYMTEDEKQKMFEFAWSNDIYLINSLTSELDALGNKNYNRERIVRRLSKEG